MCNLYYADLWIVPTSQAEIGQAYSAQFTASGGSGAVT